VTSGDRAVIAIVAALAAAAWPLAALASSAARSDSVVVSGPRGESVLRLDEPRRVTVEGLRGPVTLVVGGDAVRVVASSCPDKLCVHQGALAAPGAAIVCAPNGVTVRIGGDADAPDALVR
jgi:hypothetical protein